LNSILDGFSTFVSYPLQVGAGAGFGVTGVVAGAFGTTGAVAGAFGSAGAVAGAFGSAGAVAGAFGTTGVVAGALLLSSGGQFFEMAQGI